MTSIRRLLSLSATFALVLVACVGDSNVGPVDGGGDAGCASPKTVCTLGSQSVCTDTSSDDQNCGLCNTVCPSGTSCTGGKCACSGALTNCNGACVDLQKDPKNCGACGNECINNDCTAGECDRLVFVTDDMYFADFASSSDPLATADANCMQQAQQNQIKGTFKAWLATPQGSPSTRFTKSTTPYFLIDGTTKVANDWTDLTKGTLQHAIDKTAQKITMTSTDATRRVMTNVAADGTTASPSADCTDWTTKDTSVPVIGDPSASTGDWTHMATPLSTWNCTVQYRLYCFEQ
jgi:hypothetical protein